MLEHNENIKRGVDIQNIDLLCIHPFQHIHQSRMDRSLIVAPSSIRVACLSDANGTCVSAVKRDPTEV